jgi:hypothetical protein
VKKETEIGGGSATANTSNPIVPASAAPHAPALIEPPDEPCVLGSPDESRVGGNAA